MEPARIDHEIADGAKSVVRGIDITGTAQTTYEIQQVAKTIDTHLKKLDFEAINRAVDELQVNLALLQERLACVPVDTGETVKAVRELIDQVSTAVEQIVGRDLKNTLQHTDAGLATARSKMDQLDVAAIQNTLLEIRAPLVILLWTGVALLATLLARMVLALRR